jgi:hypothetical protein
LKIQDAEKLAIVMEQISERLHETVFYVKDRESEEEAVEYAKGIAKVLAELLFEVKEPLWEKYPELKPKSMGGPCEYQESLYEPRFCKRPEKNT